MPLEECPSPSSSPSRLCQIPLEPASLRNYSIKWHGTLDQSNERNCNQMLKLANFLKTVFTHLGQL
eukprot:6470876-Amphidinium_carterae.1